MGVEGEAGSTGSQSVVVYRSMLSGDHLKSDLYLMSSNGIEEGCGQDVQLALDAISDEGPPKCIARTRKDSGDWARLNQPPLILREQSQQFTSRTGAIHSVCPFAELKNCMHLCWELSYFSAHSATSPCFAPLPLHSCQHA